MEMELNRRFHVAPAGYYQRELERQSSGDGMQGRTGRARYVEAGLLSLIYVARVRRPAC